MKTITIIGSHEVDRTKSLISEFDDLVIRGNEDMSVSDGYHTFEELYEHRIALYIALAKSECTFRADGMSSEVWRSKKHSDGELAFGGTWFVLGIGKEKGEQITYHLPIERWDECDFAETLEVAPEWDGHTADDVLKRLKNL